MKEQTIFLCAKREDPFARVSKAALANPALPWRAKGILSYLLGKPPGWKVRPRELVKVSNDGIRSVRAGLMELRRAGYAKLVQVRTPDKRRVQEWILKVSDSPIFNGDPLDARFEHLQNAYHNKNDSTKSKRRPSRGPKWKRPPKLLTPDEEVSQKCDYARPKPDAPPPDLS